MAKWLKKLLGLAAIGGAIAGLVYYFKKVNICDDDDDFVDDFEDEDFDLDNDLKPVSDREYVPLNAAAKSEDAEDADVEEANTADTETADTETADADTEETVK